MSYRSHLKKSSHSRLRIILPATAMALSLPFLSACSSDSDNAGEAASTSSDTRTEAKQETGDGQNAYDSLDAKKKKEADDLLAEAKKKQEEFNKTLGSIDPALQATANEKHPVVFRAKGDLRNATISYDLGMMADVNLGMGEVTGVNSDWTKEAEYVGPGTPTFMVVNETDKAGEISCQVELDGKIIAESTDSETPGSALCLSLPTPPQPVE